MSIINNVDIQTEEGPMKEMELEEVVGRSAWLGQDMQKSDEWIYRLNDAEIAEINQALQYLQSTGKQIPDIGKEDFPL
eukprot:gene6027-7677_t